MDQQHDQMSLREAQVLLDQILFDETRKPAERIEAIRAILDELITAYRAERLDNDFTDVFEEIYCFKFDMPGYEALPLYYGRQLAWLPLLPKTAEVRRDFYREQLALIRAELGEQPFLYQYFKNGFTGLDEQLFVRGARVSFMLLPELPGDTAGGGWFARFTALEMLEDAVRAQLRLLEGPEVVTSGPVLPKLGWTAKQVHLVELGYALWLCGAVNDGDAKLQDIMDWLGSSLGLEIGTPANYFRDIRRRKRLTRTAFLDSLRDALNDYMDEIDELPPGVRKRRRKKLDGEEDTDYLS